jgi:hypothetical protein
MAKKSKMSVLKKAVANCGKGGPGDFPGLSVSGPGATPQGMRSGVMGGPGPIMGGNFRPGMQPNPQAPITGPQTLALGLKPGGYTLPGVNQPPTGSMTGSMKPVPNAVGKPTKYQDSLDAIMNHAKGNTPGAPSPRAATKAKRINSSK